MVPTIPAQTIDLRYLIDNFDLQVVEDEKFLRECIDDLPAISDIDKQLLDKVKAGYFNLLNDPGK